MRYPGLHGQLSLQGGSFDQKSGFASLQYGEGKNAFGISGEGFMTDRYLDPPVLENYTNHGSGGSIAGRFERNWNATDSTQMYFTSHRSGFLVPNELLQEDAGQREDRSAAETSGQISHTHLFSPNVVLQVRGMVRDTSAELWSNELSTPILPMQDRGFREGYLGGSLSVKLGSHEFKTGADALFDSIHENFGYRITAYNIGDVSIFDPSVPPDFPFPGPARRAPAIGLRAGSMASRALGGERRGARGSLQHRRGRNRVEPAAGRRLLAADGGIGAARVLRSHFPAARHRESAAGEHGSGGSTGRTGRFSAAAAGARQLLRSRIFQEPSEQAAAGCAVGICGVSTISPTIRCCLTPA